MKPTVAPTPHVRRAGLVLAILSLMVIAYATLLPEPPEDVGTVFCLLCGPLGGVSGILNVFLFAPLGLGLALSGLPPKRAILGMCALSVLIETTQFFAITGRFATVGDVITNSIGGALGFAIGFYAPVLLRPASRAASNLSLAWSVLWLAIQAISSFGFSTAIPRSEFYGEIAGRFGGFEQFRGTVVRASIDDINMPATRFPDSEKLRQLLLRPAIVRASVLPATPTSDIAPIVRIADSSQREILLLAQNDDNLMFGVRTGAAFLRLRPPYFALADAFANLQPGDSRLTSDTLSLSARYSEHEVWMRAEGRVNKEHRIPITASLGWTLLFPAQWLIEGTRTELIVSGIWVACLLLPMGYWGRGIVRFPRTIEDAEFRIMAAPIALLILYVGLVTLPHAFGVPAAPTRDWLAALIGILSGAVLARLAVRSRPPLSSAQKPAEGERYPTALP
jgi:hypothetical protein